MADLKSSAELMAATQTNLIDFLRADLATCETFAAIAEKELGSDRQHAVQAFNKAVRGCQVIAQFVMKVQDPTPQLEIEQNLALLESRLAILEAAFD
jgi:hypothetical protein